MSRPLALALVAAVLLACPERTPTGGDVRAVVVAYLECEECSQKEQAAVVARGDAVVPVLRAILRQGLSPAGRARLERQLTARYAERVAYGEVDPRFAPGMREAQYLALHLGNRAALYRVRAAVALGRIGSPAALGALRDALASPQRPDVEQAIRHALDER